MSMTVSSNGIEMPENLNDLTLWIRSLNEEEPNRVDGVPSFEEDFDDLVRTAEHTFAALRTTRKQFLNDDFLRRAQLVHATTPDFADEDFRVSLAIVANLTEDLETVVEFVNEDNGRVETLLEGGSSLVSQESFGRFVELFQKFTQETEAFQDELLEKLDRLDESVDKSFLEYMKRVRPNNDIGLSTLTDRLKEIVGSIDHFSTKLSSCELTDLRIATGEQEVIDVARLGIEEPGDRGLSDTGQPNGFFDADPLDIYPKTTSEIASTPKNRFVTFVKSVWERTKDLFDRVLPERGFSQDQSDADISDSEYEAHLEMGPVAIHAQQVVPSCNDHQDLKSVFATSATKSPVVSEITFDDDALEALFATSEPEVQLAPDPTWASDSEPESVIGDLFTQFDRNEIDSIALETGPELETGTPEIGTDSPEIDTAEPVDEIVSGGLSEPNVPLSKIGVKLSGRTNGPNSRKQVIKARSEAAHRNAERRQAQTERESADPFIVAQRSAYDILDLTRGIAR
jgi:hypothetical protein